MYCEPTYEELKHRVWMRSPPRRDRLRAYLWGIETGLWWQELCQFLPDCEPTYEELKPFFFCHFILIVLADCEPTYEELKPSSFGQGFTCPVSLRAYLWGIETCNENDSIWKFINIASLPMRNWNRKDSGGLVKFQIHCEPTYEELKL